MMSKTQWFSLLCIFMCYILFGASVFYAVESKEEAERLEKENKERDEIEELLENNYIPTEGHTKNEIFSKISDYCGKPLGENFPETTHLTWTFYHSVFFILTVVSTIGYGNLSPTTPFTRVFLIIYGIIGIPINGIVVITLGDFFGKSFLKLYKRWKISRVQSALPTLGLIGQIVLYFIPGITFFIFIPSIIIVIYEDWTYDLAIEFAFATLTTIGVGQYVPGTNENDRGETLFAIYRIFLLVWIIMGLGYLAMVFGFISRGLRSKQLRTLEHKISHNIKKTNRKIRQEMRTVLNEFLLMRVKRVYREKHVSYAPLVFERSPSCPDLTLPKDVMTPKIRKRAFSELTKPSVNLARIQSDTDLERIDKERTFTSEDNENASKQFLLRVAKALGDYDTSSSKSVSDQISCDTESEIVESDYFDSEWSIDNRNRKVSVLPLEMRPRAASESKKEKAVINFSLPWSKLTENRRMQEMREKEKYGKARSRTLPPIPKSQGLLGRLKSSFRNQEGNFRNTDIESQTQKPWEPKKKTQESEFSIIDKDKLLEETSLADFLRALSSIGIPEISTPRRKFGVVHQNVATRVRRLPITPALPARKISLLPSSPSQEIKQRRFSLSPTSTSTSPMGKFVFPTISESSDTPRSSNAVESSGFSLNTVHCSPMQRPRFNTAYSQQLGSKTVNHKHKTVN